MLKECLTWQLSAHISCWSARFQYVAPGPTSNFLITQNLEGSSWLLNWVLTTEVGDLNISPQSLFASQDLKKSDISAYHRLKER